MRTRHYGEYAAMDLGIYLDEKEITPADFARSIEVTPTSVVRYVAREGRPRPEVMARIAEVTEGAVQPNDFFMPVAEQAVPAPPRPPRNEPHAR
jgi:hypothetical protein